MSAPVHRIVSLIDALRARWLARRTAEGVVVGLAAGGVALLAALCLTVVVDAAWIRWPLVVLVLGSLLGPPLVHGLRSWWRVRSGASMAALVEACDAGLRTDVRTALEFLGKKSGDDPLRESLRVRLIERVRLRLENRQDELVAALPSASLRWPARVGAASWLGTAALVVLLADPFAHALRALAFGPVVRTETGGEEARIPLVETFSLRIVPPAYSGRPQRLLQGSSGDFQALAGSEVALRTRALVEVDEARLVIGEGDATIMRALRVAEDRTIEGTLTVMDPAPWWIEVRSEGGEGWMRDPQFRRIGVEPDLAPVVELLAPSEDMQVLADERVTVRWQASDDFGLRDASLVWALDTPDARERRIQLQEGLTDRRAQGELDLDLAELRLQPRDVIRVHVEATDNDTIQGPKVGRSQSVRIRIAAPDELNEEVIVRLQELFEALLRQLGAMLPLQLVQWTPDSSGARLEAQAAEADEAERVERTSAAIGVGAGWAEILESFTEVEERMAQDVFTPERDVELVVATAARLRDAIAATRAFTDRLEPALRAGEMSEASWARLAPLHAEELRRTESAILTLQDLVAEQQAAALERTLEELHASRDRLRELLEELRDSDDPALREQIMDEISRLEERMRELMSRLRDQMENLPREHLNLDAMEPSEVAEQMEEMGSSLDRIRELLEDGDIDGALDALNQMDSLLDQLQQEVGDPLSGAGSEGMDQFQQDMAELLEELTNLSELERQLEEETEGILEEARQERAEALQERMDALFERAEGALEAQRERLEQTDRSGFDGDLVQQMEDTEASLERLQQMMEARDVAGAQEIAERAAQAMRSLRMQSMMQSHHGTPDTRQRADELRRAAESGAAELAQLGRELDDIRRQAAPTPTPQGRQRMQELGAEQQQAAERLESLRERASELAEEYGASPIQEETFDQVGRSMQRAERALREGRPEPALEGEREALQGLQQMRQQVQRMMQRRDQQRREQQGGRELSRERIEIPDDNLSDRRRFRDQVRDAMREGSMEAFEEEVRRYYESLVQ